MGSPVPRGTGLKAVARRGRATRGALTAASTGPPLPIAGPPPLDAAKSLHSIDEEPTIGTFRTERRWPTHWL